jgi:hypothetical protein
MTNNKRYPVVNPLDVAKVAKAQDGVLRAYRRLGNWRKVGEKYNVYHTYAWDLALHGVVPSNPEVRYKLGLPRVLPSERKAKTRRESIPRIGQGGWEGFYFRKVKKK